MGVPQVARLGVEPQAPVFLLVQLARLPESRGSPAFTLPIDGRVQELEGKEKAGTLTDEEKGELAKIQAIQQRFEALKQKHLERAKDRAKRRHLTKKKALEAFPGVDKNPPARTEFAKHGKRSAMLERAREVAEAGGRDELVARIDKLLEKEQARHAAWVERHKLGKAEKGATP